MIYTIGHSTRTADEFLELLRAHGVLHVADVRTIPQSRRYPQFNRAELDNFLARAGLSYRHLPGLGGLRKPRPDSRNTAWINASFRGYADHMETAPFAAAFAELRAFGAAVPTALMCAEAVWWKCHRRLLADALVAGGVPVRHILGPSPATPHEISEFARIETGRVSYPGLL